MYVPSGIASLNLSEFKQFLGIPIDLEGKKASQLLSKKRQRRRRRSPSPASADDAVLSGDEPRRKKKEKKKEQYKSAQFIEDSGEEYAFLEKEKVQREKASLAASASTGSRPPTMKATGTKKRRRKADGKKPPKSKKPRKVKDLRHRVILITEPEPMMLNQMGSEVMRKSLSLLRQLRPDLDHNQDHLLSGTHRPLHYLPLPVPSSPVPSHSAKPSERSKRLILSDDDE